MSPSLMIGTPFAVIGLVLMGIATHIYMLDGAMKSWPSTDGAVISSRLEGSINTQAKDKWGYQRPYESSVPSVRYRYVLDSKQFDGSRIVREPSAMSPAEAKRVIDRYPVGKTVKVYYDPKDPASSVLEFKDSIAISVIVLGLIGGFFLLFGLAFVIVPRFVK
jgi:hypothetical protein